MAEPAAAQDVVVIPITERVRSMGETWGFVDRPQTVETALSPMLPTAGVNDDGGGWEYNPDDGSWSRAVYIGNPPDPENWTEHSPGVWHRK